MLNIEKEIQNIKSQWISIILSLSQNRKDAEYNAESNRMNSLRARQVADNANGLAQENVKMGFENDSAIMDLAEYVNEDDSAIMDLAEYVSYLEERVQALENGGNV